MEQEIITTTLYKRDKTGSIRTCRFEVEGNKFRSHTGVKDGKEVVSGWTVCEGKNVGRANETTPEEQTRSEMMAKFQKHLDQGYTTELSSIDEARSFAPPMLAMEYKKVTEKHPLVFPVYSQPKLDGMRCVVNKDGMWSRNGKPIVSAPHIYELLKPAFERFPFLEFDGELYSHDLKDQFEKLMSLAKKTKPTAEDLEESAEKLQYWIFDVRFTMEELLAQTTQDRQSALRGSYISICDSDKDNCIRLVSGFKAESQQDLDQVYAEYLADGYEGQMIRMNTPYENCRTRNLLKRKEFCDDEFVIVEVQEGNGNRSGIAGRVIIRLPNGETQESGLRGSHEFCRDLLANSEMYVGRLATIRYQNKTNDGKLRFPVMVAVRDFDL